MDIYSNGSFSLNESERENETVNRRLNSVTKALFTPNEI